MNTLKERIAAAQELAVQRTRQTEPELSWFLAALQATYTQATGELGSVYVCTHLRSWHHYFLKQGEFGDSTVEEIADRFIGWVRNAIELEMLVVDDPPMAKGTDPKARLVDLMAARLAELRGTTDPPPA